MYFNLKKSTFESNLFEVRENGLVVQEIQINFPIKKIPSSFESLEKITKWLQETERKLIRQKGYALIAARNYSTKGLLCKLERKGFSSSLCLELIEEFQRLGFLKDEEFIDKFIEKELRSGHGPRYIEAKLRSQGLNANQVRNIVTAERQKEVITRVLKKISRNQIAALQRRGFDFECIQQALHRSS